MNAMYVAGFVLVGGSTAIGLLVLARWLDGRAWRRSLRAYRLRLPSDLTPEMVSSWLATVNAATHAPRGAAIPAPPVALEITSNVQGIAYTLLAPKNTSGAVLASVRAGLPGARVEEAPDYLQHRPRYRVAAEARLSSHHRPLGSERAAIASTALLSALYPVGSDEHVCVQWIITGGGIVPPVASLPGESATGGLWFDGNVHADSEAVRAARAKQKTPLLRTVVRVGVTSTNRRSTYSLFGRTWAFLRILNAPGVGLVRRLLPVFVIRDRMAQLAVPLTSWPLTLGTAELAGLIGFPLGNAALPGVGLGTSRQLPTPVEMRGDVVLGVSNYPGSQRPVRLTADDRLRHTWAIGPTGVGKSTLLANMILQDAEHGRGLVLLDPKGDLVADILDRLPAHRRDDVLVLDPSAIDRPVGLNVLHSRADELHRELAVDTLVHTMSNLWRSSWGPRTSDVIRSALLTLVHTRAPDGSAFTIVELLELLLNPQFRRYVTAQAGVPPTVRPFWSSYEQMSDGERAQVIGPSLNKLRSFTTRSSLRLMLGQSTGVNLTDVFTQRRILLAPLAKGVLGTDTAALVGSLLTSQLWQAALERVTIPAAKRHPVMVYLDEFQDFLRLPLGLADMLAQARGYGVGMVLSHQYLDQLSDDVRTAIVGTTRTQIAYQLNHKDAAALSHTFAPLTTDDLTGLDRYEIAVRPCVNGRTLRPVTAATLPLPADRSDGDALADRSRQRFGTARSDVEAALRSRVETGRGGSFGRERRGDHP